MVIEIFIQMMVIVLFVELLIKESAVSFISIQDYPQKFLLSLNTRQTAFAPAKKINFQ